MQEKTLKKIAIISSLTGLLILLLLTQNMKIDEGNIAKITMGDIEKTVKVKGVITKITDREKVMFIEISEKAKINALLFKTGNLTLEKGDIVEITGKIDEYNNEPQIIIEKIVFIS